MYAIETEALVSLVDDCIRLTFTCFFSWKRIWNHVTGTTLAHLHYSCHLCGTNTQTNVWGIQADDILEKLNHDNVLDAVKGLNHITGTILLSWWPCMWGNSHTAVWWQLYKMSCFFFFLLNGYSQSILGFTVSNWHLNIVFFFFSIWWWGILSDHGTTSLSSG